MPEPGEETQICRTLERLNAGDAAAREELIVWASERMREIAHRMLRTFPTVRRWEETDDVAQNAALRLDRALRQKHRGPESYGANHETNYQRIGGDLRAKIEDAAGEAEPVDTLERWTRLHAAAEELPEEEREVFHMCWYLGLKQDEIAGLLDCSLRTVKRRWESAKQRLASAMPGGRPE